MALISALSWSRLISTVLHYPLFYSETQAELPTSPPLYTQTSYLMPFDIDLELRNNKKNYSELYMYKLYSSTNDSPSIFHKYFIRFRVTGAVEPIPAVADGEMLCLVDRSATDHSEWEESDDWANTLDQICIPKQVKTLEKKVSLVTREKISKLEKSL